VAKAQAEPASETTQAALYRVFAAQVRTIATHRGLTMAEVLKRYAGSPILREFEKCLEEMKVQLSGREG
jgi:hypothetical protein